MRGFPFAPVAAWAVAMLVAPLLAGCLDAPAPAGPLTLQQAHDAAFPAVLALAPSAHLVGFVGHEGPAPTFLKGLLGAHLEPEDTTYDSLRGDGRTYLWVLLYGTHDGSLVRAVVRAAPQQVDAAWVSQAADPVVQGLWALNLGGRLLVDAPEAVQTVRQNDAAIARHLRDHPQQAIVYASTVREVDGQGNQDLVYEILFDYRMDDSYAFYALVHHFSGRLVDAGDHAKGEAARTERLVEESFTLGPFLPEAWATQSLPQKVFDARLDLTVKGNGPWRVEILRDNETPVFVHSGQLVQETSSGSHRLGTLAPADYTWHAEATGAVTFTLRLEGIVVL